MISHSVADTNKLASRLVKGLHGGDVVGLVGPLGAGKTTFVQGLARALGVKKHITSPTFVLLHTYTLPKQLNNITTLVHVDYYRLHTPQQLIDIGIREHLDDPHALTVIEWAEKVKSLLPARTLWINFSHTHKDGERLLDTNRRFS
ncbi:MAG: tRNA (adenosine(37)-N6)-threonylcarbamoyltransferase complex ATPase subunit type 1 TsaE [Patescibacteria group bacterium]